MKSKNPMQKIYTAKIGRELVIPLVIVFGTILFLALGNTKGWMILFILLPIIFFIAYMFLSTVYILEGDQLIIRCGFLYSKTIPIQDIRQIKESNNPLSSPAPSLDRLEISYGKMGQVLISPKDKHAFTEELSRQNPAIVVVWKNKPEAGKEKS